MTEAIFGLIGVLVGSGILWFQSHWTNKKEAEKSVRYLAIRVVCILDKYMEDCAAVVKDTGYQKDKEQLRGVLNLRLTSEVEFSNTFVEDLDKLAKLSSSIIS